MDRRKTADVLFYALQCAKSDRFSFLDAVNGDPVQIKETEKDIQAFEHLQKMIFGTTRTEVDSLLDSAKSFSVFDLKKLLKDKPEMFNHAPECQCDYCKTNKGGNDETNNSMPFVREHNLDSSGSGKNKEQAE